MAAEAREFAGLLPLCSGVRRVDWPVHWARYGESGGRQLWMVANGAGATHAGDAVDVGYPACRPEVIVSMGFCGALDPALEIGDIFGATAVESAGLRVSGCACRCRTSPTRQGCWLLSITWRRPPPKNGRYGLPGLPQWKWRQPGIARQAVEYGLPLFCIRSVTDTAGQSFVTDFNGALRSDGHFDTIRILSSAMRKPGQAFPELMRLRKYCNVATHTLGGFIVGCRF